MQLPEVLRQQIQNEERRALETLQTPVPIVGEPFGVMVTTALGDTIAQIIDVDSDTIQASEPPAHVGNNIDYAFSMFGAAKSLRANPALIGQTATTSLQEHLPEYVSSVVATGPYVNIGLDRAAAYDRLLRDGLAHPENIVRTDTQHGAVLLVDFSSPNIAKRLGLQHVPTTIVGESLSRIYEASGANVIRINHVGDFGTPFGKVLVGWKLYGDPEAFAQDPVAHMHELYVRVNEEAKTTPVLNDLAREEFAALENSDPENVALWLMMREASLRENQALYDRLGINFDTTLGESFFAASGQEIVDNMVAAGTALVGEDNVVYIPAATPSGMPLVLRKSDGSSLYGTRDLAALRYRTQTYQPDGIRYVVGGEQNAHFESVFTAAIEAGILPSDGIARHVRLGLLSDQSGRKMSSRSGATATFVDTLDRSTAAARAMLLERYADIPERLVEVDRLSEILGIGAVAYTVLRKDPSANTTIADDAGAHRDAGTAGYLQYTHARTSTVLARAGLADMTEQSDQYIFTEPDEWAVAKALIDLPVALAKASMSDGPHHLAQALERLATAYSTMYQNPNVKILTEDRQLRTSRLALTRLVQAALRDGLKLLVIEAPESI